jgi:endonuclease/exonuclease/phosphatase family metal-dependent hydrolase
MAWVIGALTACATSGPGNEIEPEPNGASLTPSGHLRLVAGNLTSGNNQAYLSPGIHIFRGLAPDVAMIQEFNVGGNAASDLRGFVDQAFGTDYAFARGAASGQIPNGVVSRYPILASGEWTDSEVGNRTFVWAQIDIPGPIDLYAISVHLLSSTASERNIEAGELVQHIQGLPANAYVVLGGDFNTGSRSEAALSTLSSVLVTNNSPPVDQDGVSNTNANRNKPYDWVLTTSNLNALETDVTIGNNVFAHGLVADTRVYTPIADLAPAVASDSGASNMQHMAVVRDFALPSAPVVTVQVTAPNGGETWPAGSSQTIAWTSTGVTNISVELSTDNGVTWTTLSASTPATAGQLTITAPATATATARVRVSAVPGATPTDSSDAAFAITVAPPPVGKVFLNEILANEPGSDTAGEFVELVNSGTGDADLSGWTISDATAVRHTFAAGTTLRTGRAIVVFAGATGIPAGLTNAVVASTGTLSLGNSGDTVTLASPTGTIDSFTYTSALASSDGVSMNRSPDGSPTGTFVLHSTLSASPRSPGTRVNGTAF